MQNEALIPDLVIPAPQRRRRHVIGGAGRATLAVLPTLADIQRATPGTEIAVYDPRPSKGQALAEDALRAGVALTTRNAKLEVGAANDPGDGLIIALTDDPRTAGAILGAPWARDRPIFGSFVLGLGQERVAGIRIAAASGDERARRDGALLCERIATLRSPEPSSAITERPGISQSVTSTSKRSLSRAAQALWPSSTVTAW